VHDRTFVSDKPVFIRWFKDIGLGDVTAVGGKNASLGELYRELAAAGVLPLRVMPSGTSYAKPASRKRLRA
jgi:hypothetical protein